MEIEELIKEAQRRYPPGTKFMSITGRPVEVSGTTFKQDACVKDNILLDIMSVKNKETNWTVYDKGKWCEIIYTPKFNYDAY